MYLLYGIPNCDTVKKAMKWLEKNGIEYSFVNYKNQLLSKEKIQYWFSTIGLETVINKNSTTYKACSENEKALLESELTAIDVLQQNTSIIKRPIIELNETVVAIGFKERMYESIFI